MGGIRAGEHHVCTPAPAAPESTTPAEQDKLAGHHLHFFRVGFFSRDFLATKFQMTASRKKPGVAFWATVVAVVFVAYPFSFGPACWIESCVNCDGLVESVYSPFVRAARRSTKVNAALTHCANLCSPPTGYWDLDKYGRFSWWRLN